MKGEMDNLLPWLKEERMIFLSFLVDLQKMLLSVVTLIKPCRVLSCLYSARPLIRMPLHSDFR